MLISISAVVVMCEDWAKWLVWDFDRSEEQFEGCCTYFWSDPAQFPACQLEISQWLSRYGSNWNALCYL